jgi:hypothetical protein
VTDLTIVTCLARCLGRDFDEAVSLFQPLVEAGVPAVVYVDDVWKEPLRERCTAEHVRLQESSPQRRLASFAFGRELTAAWEASSGRGLPGLDHLVVSLSKMGMLHDQSIWNPFGTRYLVWTDVDLAVSVHPRYFTDERLLDLLPNLLRRFLFLTRPVAVTDAAGTAGASRVQGQIFGGEPADIGYANGLYYQVLDDLMRRGRLTTEESIFTQMIERSPERFDRFVLQDNGLPGFLFQQMRTGRVSLERTTVY